jgi:PIN domain
VNLYAESSAVLAWLLDEPTAPTIRASLASADLVLTSDLTLIECQRAIIRLVSLGQSTEAEAADNRARLHQTAAHWTFLTIDRDIVARASHPFPVEPIRTLDALHLASVLVARTAVPEVVLLSLDNRVRTCAYAFGFQLLPV